MTFTVRIAGTDVAFPAEKGETLLAAGERSGIVFPHACKCGFCGLCVADVVSGEFIVYPPGGKTGNPSRGPKIPVCCAEAASDAVISIKFKREERGIKVRVTRLERPAPGVLVMDLAACGGEDIPFVPGQFTDFVLEGGERRSYSIASAPVPGRPLELHIRHVPGGLCTDRLFGVTGRAAAVGDEFTITKPEGDFRFHARSGNDAVFLVTGTGFAPAKAMIEDLIRRGGPSGRVILYWGARHVEDLYLDELCREWDETLPWLTYRPLVSRATEEERWTGRTGHVQDAFIAEHGFEAEKFDAYICGTPRLVTDSTKALADAGVDPSHIHSDPFTSKADAK